jgi:hypothetical protein
MHNALRLKYNRFLDSNPEILSQAEEKMLDEGEISGRPATSYDYLEKIFQVPFVLKPMDDTGKRNLIQSQLEEKSDIQFSFRQQGTGGRENPDAGEGRATQGTGEVDNMGNPVEGRDELLKVGQDEIDFMKSIGFLLGDSPRTVKRYINIYRIIRAHAKFRFTDRNELEHYFAAMTMLGFITGTPESSKSIFMQLKSEEDETLFAKFIQNFLAREEKEHPVVEKLRDQMKANGPLHDLGRIRLQKFKANIDLISRFSFRNLA